jgi:hypothetical protein
MALAEVLTLLNVIQSPCRFTWTAGPWPTFCSQKCLTERARLHRSVKQGEEYARTG